MMVLPAFNVESFLTALAKHGVNQSELAKKVGVEAASVSHWKQVNVIPPNQFQEVEKVAATAGIDIDTLFDPGSLLQARSFSTWLREVLRDAGLSLEELAERIKTNPTVLRQHLDDHLWQPHQDTRDAIETVFSQNMREIKLEGGERLVAFPNEKVRIEGGMVSVILNRYERNATARSECIKFNGTRCTVCGIDMGEVYGKIGQGFIHIHHLVRIADTGKDHQVDPKTDLVPVCPNCHAMIHRHVPPFTPEEIREDMEAARRRAQE